MRKIMALLIFAAAAVPGCGGGPNPAEEDRKHREMENRFTEKINELERKYASMMQMEMTAKKAVEDAQRMTKVNDVVVRLLQVQESALKDQLKTIQDLIKEFQPK